jgi:hypothetical protein
MKNAYLLLTAIILPVMVSPGWSQASYTLPVINVFPLDAEAGEGPAGDPQTASFRLTHSFPPSANVSFLFTLGGTAREGADFRIGSGANLSTNVFGRWFTFPTGQNEALLTIAPIDDLLVEPEETIALSLYTPPFNGTPGVTPEQWRDAFGFAFGGNAVATVSLRSDDQAPPAFAVVSVAATDATAAEIPPALGFEDTAVFTLTRSGANLGAVTVSYAFEELLSTFPPLEMAQNGVDFEAVSGTVTFAAGSTTAEIVIRPIFDVLDETSEYVRLRLQPSLLPVSDPASYVLDEQTSAVAHISNFTFTLVPVVTVEASDPQAVEDEVIRRTGTVIFRRERGTQQTLSVPYQLSGTAQNGVDYVKLSGVVTFPAGVGAVTVEIEPIDDNVPEGVESVGITVLPPPDTGFPPAYLVGARSGAGIAIRDKLRPPGTLPNANIPWIERLSDGSVLVGVSAQDMPTARFVIEASLDLLRWESIGTAAANEGVAQFIDLHTGSLPFRFYRVRAVAPAESAPAFASPRAEVLGGSGLKE